MTAVSRMTTDLEEGQHDYKIHLVDTITTG